MGKCQQEDASNLEYTTRANPKQRQQKIYMRFGFRSLCAASRASLEAHKLLIKSEHSLPPA
jgi:hypothetical protein